MERTREASLKGWLFVILPITIILMFILVYGIQELTGIQVYTLINNPKKLDGSSESSSSKILMARGLLFMMVVVAMLFLARMWQRQGGATGFLVGGRIGRSGAFQTDLQAYQESSMDAFAANDALTKAKKAHEASIAQNRQNIANELGRKAAQPAPQNPYLAQPAPQNPYLAQPAQQNTYLAQPAQPQNQTTQPSPYLEQSISQTQQPSYYSQLASPSSSGMPVSAQRAAMKDFTDTRYL